MTFCPFMKMAFEQSQRFLDVLVLLFCYFAMSAVPHRITLSKRFLFVSCYQNFLQTIIVNTTIRKHHWMVVWGPISGPQLPGGRNTSLTVLCKLLLMAFVNKVTNPTYLGFLSAVKLSESGEIGVNRWLLASENMCPHRSTVHRFQCPFSPGWWRVCPHRKVSLSSTHRSTFRCATTTTIPSASPWASGFRTRCVASVGTSTETQAMTTWPPRASQPWAPWSWPRAGRPMVCRTGGWDYKTCLYTLFWTVLVHLVPSSNNYVINCDNM